MNPSARPEARWALWSGVMSALVTTALSVKGIFASGSSTAALGFIALPLVAALGAIPVAAWGAALGHVVLRLRGRVQSPPMVLVAALAVAAALPLAVGVEIARGLRLESAVREVRGMDVAQLGRAFEDSPFRRDRYFLGAIAQNPATQGDVLGRIAALREPEFYEPMGSLWDVMGDNRKGLAVIRLVARHPNTDAATLARLATEPNAQVAVHELAANPRTPMPVLERWFNSTDYLVKWGLASNPNTPRAILERLARDSDENLARNAALAIERRKKGE